MVTVRGSIEAGTRHWITLSLTNVAKQELKHGVRLTDRQVEREKKLSKSKQAYLQFWSQPHRHNI